ncbi:MAG: hypothetical protein EOP83_20895 [Verrucomicrobiaceae bacterium]|nr:MAG: hypothetical protein EOP83_20895 [Verrucomicrobiaceae bacterium]
MPHRIRLNALGVGSLKMVAGQLSKYGYVHVVDRPLAPDHTSHQWETDQITAWVKEHLVEDYVRYRGPVPGDSTTPQKSRTIWAFKNPDDAFVFKMKWG